MKPSFEIFDHTADMGVRVVAPTMPGLIRPATEGFYSTIGELTAAKAGEREPFNFDVAGDDPAILLRDYLTQLLLLFEGQHRLVTEFTAIDFSPRHLAVRASSAPVDLEASIYSREVKAITYHELAIRPIDGGFEARFIVDI